MTPTPRRPRRPRQPPIPLQPPAPSDDLWIELTQFDTRLADAMWDGARAPDEGGPRWRDDLATLIEAARRAAAPDELAGEATVVAAMQAARAKAQGPARPVASLRPTEHVSATGLRGAGLGVGGEQEAAGRDRPVRPRRRSRVHLVGRVVVAKGVAAVGAVGFGVAAAAATTGIVASGIVASLVVPELVEGPGPAAESPADSEVAPVWPLPEPDEGGVADGRGGTPADPAVPGTGAATDPGRSAGGALRSPAAKGSVGDDESEPDGSSADTSSPTEGTAPGTDTTGDAADALVPDETVPAESTTTTSSTTTTTTVATTTSTSEPSGGTQSEPDGDPLSTTGTTAAAPGAPDDQPAPGTDGATPR